MFIRILCLIAATLLASAAWAQDYKLGSLEISQPWTRATAPTAKAGGGFVTITNKGTTPDRLIAARSTTSAKAEIHEMKMDGNVMRMRELDKGLEIPPGATVELKPGSYHLMLMDLKAPAKAGDTIKGTLVFEKAGKVDIEYTVRGVGGQSGQKH